jgi:ADP-ribosyltransferase exoenzyme
MSKIGSSGRPSPPPRPSTQAPNTPVGKSGAQDQSAKSTSSDSPNIKPADIKPGLKTRRTSASEAHAQSSKGEKAQGEVSKQKELFQDVKREGENIAIISKQVAGKVGQQASVTAGKIGEQASAAADKIGEQAGRVGEKASAAAGKIGEKASVAAKGLFDQFKSGDAKALAMVQKAFPEDVAQDFKTTQEYAKKKLASHEKEIAKAKSKGEAITQPQEEKLDRLQRLNQALKDEPIRIAKNIEDHRGDPAYQFMGPGKFSSFEVMTRQLVAENEKARGKSYDLKPMERVAIYGYTTSDYGAINSALRSPGGVQDPQLKAYKSHIEDGLKKLDYFDPQQGQKLYRGMNSSPQITPYLKKDGVLSDAAFVSTSMKYEAIPGDVKMTISAPPNKGRILPFSASPGEGEVLFLPGTQLTFTDKKGMDPKLAASLKLTPDKIAEWEANNLGANNWNVQLS